MNAWFENMVISDIKFLHGEKTIVWSATAIAKICTIYTEQKRSYTF